MLSLCCGCNEGGRGGWEGGREEVGERKREGGGRDGKEAGGGRMEGGKEAGGGRREGGKEAGGGRGRRDHVNAQYANSVQSPEHRSVQACSTQVS